MPLTAGEKASVLVIIPREGGLQQFIDQVKAAYTAQANATVVANLTPAITVTVSNWAAVGAYVAAPPPNLTVATVMADIVTAAQAQDATKLGPLFVGLYTAVKKQLGL